MKGSSKIIGRSKELKELKSLLTLGRNILLEGPVGVGKTFLVREALENLKLGYERVDGDTRYTEQKLTGWFDPPLVLKKGYEPSTFIDGPLVLAMREGKVLFINELNRMPEAVQNILLPAMDERQIVLPKIGEIVAKKGFLVVATQNPKEFTATHALSEALLDRFEMVRLQYQSRDEEIKILEAIGSQKNGDLERVVDLVRATRAHEGIKRGSSIRGALAMIALHESGMSLEQSALLALPSRIELVSSEDDPCDIIKQLLAMSTFPVFNEKKKKLIQK